MSISSIRIRQPVFMMNIKSSREMHQGLIEGALSLFDKLSPKTIEDYKDR